MDGYESKWLRSVLGIIKTFQSDPGADLEALRADLTQLAWVDSAPKLEAFAGGDSRFRRHPLAGAEDMGCSALLMYWPPGHATLPHDHGGLWGIEVVLDGELHVDEFIKSGSDRAPVLIKSRSLCLGIGDSAAFRSARYVHRCRNVSNVAPSLTLHVYGGALERYLAFDRDAKGVLVAEPVIAISDAPLE